MGSHDLVKWAPAFAALGTFVVAFVAVFQPWLRRREMTNWLEQPVTNFFAVEQGHVTVMGDEQIPAIH